MNWYRTIKLSMPLTVTSPFRSYTNIGHSKGDEPSPNLRGVGRMVEYRIKSWDEKLWKISNQYQIEIQHIPQGQGKTWNHQMFVWDHGDGDNYLFYGRYHKDMTHIDGVVSVNTDFGLFHANRQRLANSLFRAEKVLHSAFGDVPIIPFDPTLTSITYEREYGPLDEEQTIVSPADVA